MRILAVLAIATIAVLAQAILLPITVAFLLALALRPVVRRCRRLGLPDALSATVLLAALVVAGIIGISSVLEPARHWMESAPAQLQKIQDKLSAMRTNWNSAEA